MTVGLLVQEAGMNITNGNKTGKENNMKVFGTIIIEDHTIQLSSCQLYLLC